MQGFKCNVSATCQASTHFSASPLSQLVISLEADPVASSSSLLCACNTALNLVGLFCGAGPYERADEESGQDHG